MGIEECNTVKNRKKWMKCLAEKDLIPLDAKINKINKAMDVFGDILNNPEHYGMYMESWENPITGIENLYFQLDEFREGYWERS